MKTNFKKIQSKEYDSQKLSPSKNTDKKLTQKEFENYVVESGARGSFMIYRSQKKDDEFSFYDFFQDKINNKSKEQESKNKL